MIPLHKVYMPPRDQLMPELERVLYSGYVAEGVEVEEFERRFGDLVGNRNVLAVSSCTAALHLALELIGVRGGLVVSTSMTAEPTNVAIHMAGARVVWADVDPLTGNVTGDTVAEAVEWGDKHSASCRYDSVRAVMVVHYGGIPVVKFDHSLPLIEDCAHALGAQPTGWGTYQCYSFQAIKQLSTVEGGALVFSFHDDEAWREARRLRWFGLERGVSRTMVDLARAGWKYNWNNVQATIGLAQLKTFQGIDVEAQVCGLFFDEALKDIPGVVVAPPTQAPAQRYSYWLYTILVERRDDLMRKLRERGVECGQVHRRNDLHSAFAYAKRELPGLDSYYSKMFHIPCGWWVNEADRRYIVDVIRSGW